MSDEIYLGDGLYASFDGFYFWLRATHSEGDQEVALNKLTLKAFFEFVEEQINSHLDNTHDPRCIGEASAPPQGK